MPSAAHEHIRLLVSKRRVTTCFGHYFFLLFVDVFPNRPEFLIIQSTKNAYVLQFPLDKPVRTVQVFYALVHHAPNLEVALELLASV